MVGLRRIAQKLFRVFARSRFVCEGDRRNTSKENVLKFPQKFEANVLSFGFQCQRLYAITYLESTLQRAFCGTYSNFAVQPVRRGCGGLEADIQSPPRPPEDCIAFKVK